MPNDTWDKLHTIYKKQDWINKPNLFAQNVVQYFPKKAKILELGAGQGQDTRFFAENGFTVVSTDISDLALEVNKEKLPDNLKNNVIVKKLDLVKAIPFKDKEFDVVYAHLSLHYFDKEETQHIFREIYRVLKDGGILSILNNSISDPEYIQGQEIEPGYLSVDGTMKRFFSVDSLKEYIKNFKIILLDNLGTTYKDEAKGVNNLIRFVGTKL